MSCRPAVPQSTRSYVVRRLDDADQELILSKKARGKECLDKVCKSLGLLEKEYFGLCYNDKNGERLWVNLCNPLYEQLPQGNHVVMEMRVKYFISPHKILQPVTRYQFYQQTKRDLLQGRLLLDTAIRAARVCGLMAQVDHGDYKPDLQYGHTVVVQGVADNLEARIRREHQKLAGLSTEIAIEKFLSEVSGLPLYGVELYSINGGSQYVGVGPEYMTLYNCQKTAIKQYSYSSVKYTAFQGKKFKALIRHHDTRSSEELEVELSSRAASQALYRAVTEFHTFFRRDTVSSVVKTAGYCKSLLGNIKSQTPDRFYFDVTRTHKEVVNHVWSLLHSSDQTRQSVPPSPRLRRGRSQHDPLPPIPGIPSNVPPSGSRLQRAVSMQHPLRPNVCYQQMPPLPTFQQASHSADGIVINNRPHLVSQMTSLMPYTSQTISETSDDASSTYSSEYTTMSSRLGPGYTPDSASSSQGLSDTYVTSTDSVASGVSHNHSTLNSPPPGYSEVDPDQHSTPMNFPDPSRSPSVASPSEGYPLSGEGVFSFDTTSVLTRTRELEGELQRLRSAMTCRLCKQNPIGATFCPCGHTVCCFSCAQRLRTCWECDVLVHSVQRMLLASNV